MKRDEVKDLQYAVLFLLVAWVITMVAFAFIFGWLRVNTGLLYG